MKDITLAVREMIKEAEESDKFYAEATGGGVESEMIKRIGQKENPSELELHWSAFSIEASEKQLIRVVEKGHPASAPIAVIHPNLTEDSGFRLDLADVQKLKMLRMGQYGRAMLKKHSEMTGKTYKELWGEKIDELKKSTLTSFEALRASRLKIWLLTNARSFTNEHYEMFRASFNPILKEFGEARFGIGKPTEEQAVNDVSQQKAELISKKFKYRGFSCEIVLRDLGHYCGYVDIPNAGPLFFHSVDQMPPVLRRVPFREVSVHGGLKFFGDSGRIGLECNGLWDLIPGIHKTPESRVAYDGSPRIYRTSEFVGSELRRLVDQIIIVEARALASESGQLDSELDRSELDRFAFGNGPWNTEPDRETFEYKGFFCTVKRAWRGSHLCGYVFIPTSSSLSPHAATADDPAEDSPLRDLDVHGGITSAHEGRIGFDCAHASDLIPSIHTTPESRIAFDGSQRVYRTVDFVKSELERLVDQLIVLEAKAETFN